MVSPNLRFIEKLRQQFYSSSSLKQRKIHPIHSSKKLDRTSPITSSFRDEEGTWKKLLAMLCIFAIVFIWLSMAELIQGLEENYPKPYFLTLFAHGFYLVLAIPWGIWRWLGPKLHMYKKKKRLRRRAHAMALEHKSSLGGVVVGRQSSGEGLERNESGEAVECKVFSEKREEPESSTRLGTVPVVLGKAAVVMMKQEETIGNRVEEFEEESMTTTGETEELPPRSNKNNHNQVCSTLFPLSSSFQPTSDKEKSNPNLSSCDQPMGGSASPPNHRINNTNPTGSTKSMMSNSRGYRILQSGEKTHPELSCKTTPSNGSTSSSMIVSSDDVDKSSSSSYLDNPLVDERCSESHTKRRRYWHNSKVNHPNNPLLLEEDNPLYYIGYFNWCYFFGASIPIGVFAFVSGWLWYLSLPLTSVSGNTAIYQSACAMVYVISVILLKESVTKTKVLSVTLSVVGVFCISFSSFKGTSYISTNDSGFVSSTSLVQSHNTPCFGGYILCLLSMILYACFEVLYKKWASHSCDSVPLMNSCRFLFLIGASTILFCTPPLLLLDVYQIEIFEIPRGDNMQLLIVLGLLDSLFNLFLLFAIMLSSPLFASVGCLLVLPASVVWDSVFHNYNLPFGGLVGVGLIVTGFLGFAISEYRQGTIPYEYEIVEDEHLNHTNVTPPSEHAQTTTQQEQLQHLDNNIKLRTTTTDFSADQQGIKQQVHKLYYQMNHGKPQDQEDVRSLEDEKEEQNTLKMYNTNKATRGHTKQGGDYLVETIQTRQKTAAPLSQQSHGYQKTVSQIDQLNNDHHTSYFLSSSPELRPTLSRPSVVHQVRSPGSDVALAGSCNSSSPGGSPDVYQDLLWGPRSEDEMENTRPGFSTINRQHTTESNAAGGHDFEGGGGEVEKGIMPYTPDGPRRNRIYKEYVQTSAESIITLD